MEHRQLMLRRSSTKSSHVVEGCPEGKILNIDLFAMETSVDKNVITR